nr:30S ribosomal protein S3P [uncultured archaeon]AJS13302.1 30S ribosomal protein S3P [uncultured archaeon]
MASERKFVTENIRRHLLREYMMAKVGRAGFGGLDVQRTPMGTRVTLMTERPGLVIGRRGEAIKLLTKAIEEEFKFNNPQIEVQEVPNPNLNAQIMAEKLANALERGWHFRRAGHSTVRRIMDSGARGCQVVIAGKLTGARHRTEKFKEGHIKYCGQAKLDFMEKGFAVAKLKPGVMGITVNIMNPNARLPDEIEIIPPPAEAAPAVEAPKPAADMVAEEKKAAEAVATLKKEATAATGAIAAAQKPKRARKKKVVGAPEGAATAAAPEGTPGADDKKSVRKRKKKDGSEEAAAPPATEAITEVKPGAIMTVEPKPLAEVPEKKPEEKKPEAPPVEEKKEA